jgi:biopolymer transport protein ExbD
MRPPLVASKPLLDRVNVTPIIDVALVLVIILLITAPMLTAADLDVTLPKAQSRGEEERAAISVTVGRGGELALDEQRVADAAALGAALAARLDAVGGESPLVVVRADAVLAHAEVRRILDAVRASGARRVAVAVRQGGGERR